MKSFTSRVLAVALTTLMALGGMAAETDNVPEIEAEGLVQKVELGANSAVISGVSYHFPATAKVEIGGSYGAFTMLQSGMKVEFIYRRHADNRREIVELMQLPDSYPLEES